MLRIIAFITALFQMLIPSMQLLINGEDSYCTKWSQTQQYNPEDTVIIEKKADKDFVILNLTDTQLNDAEALGKFGTELKDTVRKLVAQTKPDLITLTGDNGWGYIAYTQLFNLLDSFDIPWAPVMGNHDNSDENTAWVSAALENTKNSVFSVGPENMGYGNYIVNVSENEKIVESLIFVDTHSSADFTLEDGSTTGGYDNLWGNQIEWYKWAVNGVQQYGVNGKVKSIVFAHIPVVEFNDAYNAAWDENTQSFRDGFEAFGEKNEDVCCSPVNNGFFNVMKQCGSTTDFVCGHDHINSYSILYQGIRLTYGLKTGAGCYWKEGASGGTTLTVDSTGKTVTQHVYIEPEYNYSFIEPELWAY